MRVLVTGATGEVGEALLRALGPRRGAGVAVRAAVHRRPLALADGLEVVTGSLADGGFAAAAMRDVSHLVHLPPSRRRRTRRWTSRSRACSTSSRRRGRARPSGASCSSAATPPWATPSMPTTAR